MPTKLIAITSARRERTTAQNSAYLDAFTRPGYSPILLPCFELESREVAVQDDYIRAFADHIARYTEISAGLVISGGPDVSPVPFNVPNVNSNNCDIMRDYMEAALIRSFIEAGKPILGICKGHQLLGLSLRLGGFLQHIHIPGEPHNAEEREIKHPQEPLHLVTLRKGLRIYLEQRTNRQMPYMGVNSRHHQGFVIDGPKPKKVKGQPRPEGNSLTSRVAQYEIDHGIEVLAYSPGAILEAFAKPDIKAMGVQWHLEEYPNGLMSQYWLDTYVAG